MSQFDPRLTSRWLRLATVAIVVAALLPLPGFFYDVTVRAQVAETQAAADRFLELRSRLDQRATGHSSLDLAEDVALRRGFGDIIGVLQAHPALQPGTDLLQWRFRLDAWFAGRSDVRLTDDLEGALSATVRAARVRGRWSRQLAFGLDLLALLPAGVAFMILLQEQRRLRQPASAPSQQVPAVPRLAPVVAAPAPVVMTPVVAASAVLASAAALRREVSTALPLAKRSSSSFSTNPSVPIGPLCGRVLVVEDNPINQRVTQRQLSELALQVEVVADGECALLRLHAEKWDAVLMDLQLPGIDGLIATRRWREHEATCTVASHLPIVAITANALGTDRDACFAAGMDGYLAKPARLEDLHRALSRFLPAAGSESQIPRLTTASVSVATANIHTADLPFYEPVHVPVHVPLPALTDPLMWAKLRSETARSDPRMLEELLCDLQQHAPQALDEMQAALTGSDWERLRATAHRFKGSAGMLGLPRLAVGAKALESAAKVRDLGLALEALTALQSAFPATFADPAVQAWIVS